MREFLCFFAGVVIGDFFSVTLLCLFHAKKVDQHLATIHKLEQKRRQRQSEYEPKTIEHIQF